MKSTKRYYLFFYIDIVISGQNYHKLDISKTLNASSKLVPKILCLPAADLTSYNIEPSIRVPQNPCACRVVSRVFKSCIRCCRTTGQIYVSWWIKVWAHPGLECKFFHRQGADARLNMPTSLLVKVIIHKTPLLMSIRRTDTRVCSRSQELLGGKYRLCGSALHVPCVRVKLAFPAIYVRRYCACCVYDTAAL